MNKEELLATFDHELRTMWNVMLAEGYSDTEAADYLYDQYLIAYWERDILKGE